MSTLPCGLCTLLVEINAPSWRLAGPTVCAWALWELLFPRYERFRPLPLPLPTCRLTARPLAALAETRCSSRCGHSSSRACASRAMASCPTPMRPRLPVESSRCGCCQVSSGTCTMRPRSPVRSSSGRCRGRSSASSGSTRWPACSKLADAHACSSWPPVLACLRRPCAAAASSGAPPTRSRRLTLPLLLSLTLALTLTLALALTLTLTLSQPQPQPYP